MLGVSSESKLRGVHPDLVRTVRIADQIMDRLYPGLSFIVLEGLRTPQRQAQLVAVGASWTNQSRHLTGHAVDLGALINDQVAWDWSLYYKIGDAMRRASINAAVPIVWGGVWDRRIDELTLEGGTEDDVLAYVARRRSEGKPARIDGPHFELDHARYPA